MGFACPKNRPSSGARFRLILRLNEWPPIVIPVKSTIFTTLLLGVSLLNAEAQPSESVRYGQTIKGDIGVSGEGDYYHFSATPGDRLLIPVVSASSVEPWVIVSAPDGTEIARTNAPGLGWNSPLRVGASGDYKIEVRDRSNRTGAYALSLFCLNKSNPADEDRATIVPGKTTAVHIEPGDFDSFEFQGAVGETFIAVALRTGNAHPPMFGVYAPNGEVIQEKSSRSGIWLSWAYENEASRQGGHRISQQGIHRIVYGIRSGVSTAHDAGLTLIKHPWPNESDPDGGELLPSVLRTGELTAGNVDCYFFYGTSGDVVNLRMTTTRTTYPAIWLLGPDGVQVAYKDDGVQASVENLRLPSTGIHLVICYSYLAYLGNYSLLLSGTIQEPQFVSPHFSYLGDTHEVFWLDRPGWNLEFTDSVSSGSWLPEPSKILSTGGFKTVNLQSVSKSRFYRLVHP